MTQKVSELLNGQLAGEEVGRALEEVAAAAELRDRFTLYNLIGDVLRGNSTPDDGYTKRIMERMQREGVRIEQDFDPLKDD